MSSSKQAAGSSTNIIRSICILGGPVLGNDEAYRHAAYDLGRALAARKIHVVYGGGLQGLKGCTVGTAVTKGSQALDVAFSDGSHQKTPSLVLGHTSKVSTMTVSTMQERMAQMLFNSDAFIAMPGGLETFEDVLSVVSWANFNYHQKPLGFLNTNGFYDGLLNFLENSMHQGFTPPKLSKIMTQSSNPNVLIEQMQTLAFEAQASERKRKRDEEEKDDKDKAKDKAKGKKKIELDTTLRL